jgi:DNA primase
MDNWSELKTNPRAIEIFRERVFLKKESGNWVGKCPFHSEKTGSLIVNNKEGYWLFKCFGCGVGGSVLDFIQKLDNCSLSDAVKTIREKFSGWAASKKRVDETFKPMGKEEPAKTYTLEQYQKSGWESALEQSEAAKAWLLNERGIGIETALKHHLGFRQTVNGDDGGWITFPYISDGLVIGIKYRSIARKTFIHQPGMRVGLFNLEN